jgi:hypothetical protein
MADSARGFVEKPFFFAIETSGGDWKDGEQCVFEDKVSAQDEVDNLNEELPEEDWYKVVPLYRHNPNHDRALWTQAQEQMREKIEQRIDAIYPDRTRNAADGMLQKCITVVRDTPLDPLPAGEGQEVIFPREPIPPHEK